MSWLSRLKQLFWPSSKPPAKMVGGYDAASSNRKRFPGSPHPAGLPTRREDSGSTQDLYPTTTSTYSINAGKFQLRVGVVSVVGGREHNEDNFYVPGRASLNNSVPTIISAGTDFLGSDPEIEVAKGSLHNGSGRNTESPLLAASTNGPSGLFIVADGMGGQLAGEKASQMAVEMIPVEVARRLHALADEKATKRALQDAVAKANEEILALSHIGTEYANMGTTVVLAQFKDDRAYVAGIGDSRAYLLRDGKLEQLTRDHSLATALGEAGTIRPEEVETHKFKHVLYLYLGSKDARDGPEDVRVVDTRPGDRFLLATDGLMGVVRDDEIADMLMTIGDAQEASLALVNRALELRSKDNVTALVIHLV